MLFKTNSKLGEFRKYCKAFAKRCIERHRRIQNILLFRHEYYQLKRLLIAFEFKYHFFIDEDLYRCQ